MYTIITLDGPDGIGKATIAKRLQEDLTKRGFKVVKISPPFYDSYTGKLIKDYLTQQHSYGCIADRRILSMMYSMDRNIWMKNHFDEFWYQPLRNVEKLTPYHDNPIFNTNASLVFIYDRSWLSSLFYQTTMTLPDSNYNKQIFPNIVNITRKSRSGKFLPGRPSYTFNAPDALDACKRAGQMIQNVPDIAKPGDEEEVSAPHYLATHPAAMETVQNAVKLYRLQTIYETIHSIYDVEISPWKGLIVHPKGTYPTTTEIKNGHLANFLDAARAMINIVLVPEAKSGASEVCMEHMMERYEGDKTKLDNHEKSMSYLDSVIENIHFIKDNWIDIGISSRSVLNLNTPEYDKAATAMGRAHYDDPRIQMGMRPLNRTECFAFRPDLVLTTENDRPLELDEIYDMVCRRIWAITDIQLVND